VAEGSVTVSVIAYDADENASEPAAVSLNVAAEVAEGAPEEETSGEATKTPEPTEAGEAETPAPEVTTESGCSLNADFVADVTIPDDTELAPGSGFAKTWRVRNTGTCDWGAGFELIFVSGAQMGGPAAVTVSATSAGDTVDVTVDLTAPAVPGQHKATWRLRSDEGAVFGPNLTVVIVVPEPATETHTPTPTDEPTLTPSPSPTWKMGIIVTGVIVSLVPPLSVDLVYESGSVAAGGTSNAVATCPADSIVTGGGYAGNADADFIIYNTAMVGNAWRVYASNKTSSQEGFSARAMCLSGLSGATTSQHHTQGTVAANDTGHVQVMCPSGSVPTGGGWAANHQGTLLVYNSSLTSNGRGWQVYAKNTSGSSELLNAYVVCLSNVNASVTRSYERVTVAKNATGSSSASCDSGVLTGGGFAASSDLVIYTQNYSNGEWTVYAKNLSSSGKLLDSYAVCLTLE
jgi:hypothetical protein